MHLKLYKLLFCGLVLFFLNNSIFSQETYYFAEDGTGRLHTFEVEQVALLSSADSSVKALSSDEKFFRCIYDDDMRLVSKVTWKINKADKTSSVILKEDFFYKEDSLTAFQANEYNLENKSLVKNYFSASGLLKKVEKYDLSTEKEEKLLSKDSFVYNSEDKLTEKELIAFDSEGNKTTERFVLQIPGNERSGYDYYKNNVLLRSVKYTSENDYTQRIFFDAEKSVLAVYENGILVDEVFSIKGKEFRRKK